jgi:hypothetical protein
MTPSDTVLDHHAIRRLAELARDRDDLIVSVVEPDDGTILWCSEPGLRRITDRGPEEVVGRPTCLLVPTSDWSQLSRTRSEAASGRTVSVAGEIERPNGRRIRTISTAWRVDGDTGPVVALTLKDPTERRR